MFEISWYKNKKITTTVESVSKDKIGWDKSFQFVHNKSKVKRKAFSYWQVTRYRKHLFQLYKGTLNSLMEYFGN